ncbi:dolichol kinase [Plectosphaerella cucumerina]|uniref:dolichol kinase n=1 Tax=Plectosphaerella cucumerina TaxID=40658 RepID=A0A8K0X3E3_9PEZI|nr:dolichol kinase [Plectosphaerella cucumerina]
MPDRLNLESLSTGNEPEDGSQLRHLTRSPHPYHHLNSELPHAAHRVPYRAESSLETTQPSSGARSEDSTDPSPSFPSFTKESTPASDSGTEADDEHFLKGLPAPKVRLHKGLRHHGDGASGTSSPMYSPSVVDEDYSQHHAEALAAEEKKNLWDERNTRRAKELARRTTELIIVGGLFIIVQSHPDVKPIFKAWSKELLFIVYLSTALVVLYPFRLVAWTYLHRKPIKKIPIFIPTIFDPAAILYPPAVSLLVALLLATDNPAIILPTIILSISAIPRALIPTAHNTEAANPLHWVFSCMPLYMATAPTGPLSLYPATADRPAVSPQTAVLLYPLHQAVICVLHYLTTTSLLTAELELLSIALIDLGLMAHSPQASILKVLLWIGGVLVLLLCGPVIRWAIALARVPRLRFRRVSMASRKSWWALIREALSFRSLRNDARALMDDTASETVDSDDDIGGGLFRKPSRVRTFTSGSAAPDSLGVARSMSARASFDTDGSPLTRISTFPGLVNRPRRSATHTFSGRRKRASSSTVRSFFRLTETQAFVRRWMYSAYVHLVLVAIVLWPVRWYIGEYGLKGSEPIGWALGYLFGDIPWFRFQVVSRDLERWIFLPARPDEPPRCCDQGWVHYIRTAEFGEANTRLLICAYYLTVITTGLIVVTGWASKYEVDTRRKVFHFTVVAMFLSATYVDPVFTGLALSFILAIFLILDLLRASQLPPLSKPIASFLTPYVDGRDHKGPVVISHIFLLIGCAIPLWLTLATLPRSGPVTGALSFGATDPFDGWEVPTREVSMVAGVVCVGLGDAAASLIGRRFGRRKWVWGGGKSIEGSVAFAAAVFAGLMAATAWLRVGGWPVTPSQDVPLPVAAQHAAICGVASSLTEAVLTGGNDNVIVPVVLWMCVKSLGV